MTIYEMTQLVCGTLPEGFELTIEMENGSGVAKLWTDDGDCIEGHELEPDDADIETQVVELVKFAKGESSMFRRGTV